MNGFADVCELEKCVQVDTPDCVLRKFPREAELQLALIFSRCDTLICCMLLTWQIDWTNKS
eukprot:2309897-Amphidinium_carterae.1